MFTHVRVALGHYPTGRNHDTIPNPVLSHPSSRYRHLVTFNRRGRSGCGGVASDAGLFRHREKSGGPTFVSLPVALAGEHRKADQEHEPQAVAIEGVFYAKNVKTMLILSHARGAIIAQCARMGIPVYEYEPRRVKLAVVGTGGAQKEQVQKMVKTLLNLPEVPQNDAADALALAITHLHNRSPLAALSASPI